MNRTLKNVAILAGAVSSLVSSFAVFVVSSPRSRTVEDDSSQGGRDPSAQEYNPSKDRQEEAKKSAEQKAKHEAQQAACREAMKDAFAKNPTTKQVEVENCGGKPMKVYGVKMDPKSGP